MKLLCVSFLFAWTAVAQPASFEAASIKPNRSGSGSSSTHRSRGQITMENVTVRKMTLMAYGIPDDREYALAGPDWLGGDRFDVVARHPGDSTPEQLRAMLQDFLAVRFHLALHREMRQLPQYVLVVAKGGPKIQPVTGPGGSDTRSAAGRLEASRITIQHLADLFARFLGQPVVNETGLQGVYSFTLEWSPDETVRMGPGPETAASSTGPSLFSALQEQLGLKLEGRKGPVEVLVVDHIDRTPTEN